jgi:hypothetical protein
MSGLFLFFWLVLAVITFIMMRVDDYSEDVWGVVSVICFILFLSWLVAIPISRIDSKQNVEYVKVFQETLDYNRANVEELNVFERATIIEEINECNAKINKWRVKGQKWYYNKWYYHPDTQKAEFVK